MSTSTACVFVLLLCILPMHLTAASEFSFLEQAREDINWLVSTRRALHRIPELLYDLPLTSAAVRGYLDELGIPHTPAAGSGVVGMIGTGGPPFVALRADMDALPIIEASGVDFASEHPGAMHACGHDAHMTMLLGAARLLKAVEHRLPGTVRLVFQPAEEGGAGGERMVQEGVFQDVGAAFGFHVWPSLPSGGVYSRPGFFMAGAIRFELVVRGRGGHAAIPELLADPVVASAAIITALQTLVSRETSPFDSAVLSIPKLVAGRGRAQAHNVVPDSVFLGGVVRATSDAAMQRLRARVAEVVAAVAAAHGCVAELDWAEDATPYYPPTINDPALHAFADGVATGLLGAGAVGEYEGTMAAEDFSFIARAVPATFMFLGIRNETLGSVHGLHTDQFMMDESVLPVGAALHASLARKWLEREAAATAPPVQDEL
uniref:Peptidase M20 dimerisation domain-containing protein n=1 Tax=Auxenochlorella protothecoides TaxID=3075 RepID=A0A1D2A0P9_AUXPR